MSTHQRFNEFYGNNKNTATCHKPKNTKLTKTPVGNTGLNAYCPWQKGGNPKGQMFTATGELMIQQPSPSPVEGSPIYGYFLDITKPPIGGRPVHSSYNNTKGNGTPYGLGPVLKNNLLKRKFGCKQPMWTEECL